MKQWLRTRNRRQLIALACGVICALGALLYLTLSPVVEKHRRLLAEIPSLRANLAWMRANADEARSRNVSHSMDTGLNTQTSITALVENALIQSGLQEQIGGIRSEGLAMVNIDFNEVMYAELMEFVYMLGSNYPASVKQARVSRVADKPGRVRATLVIGAE